MEHRKDLADILFAGLPDGEADHVRDVIRRTDADLLARKRAMRERSEVLAGSVDEIDDESDEDALV